MQRLYENHKVLTYPRTDSRYIGTDVVPTIKERLKACNQGLTKPISQPFSAPRSAQTVPLWMTRRSATTTLSSHRGGRHFLQYDE